MNQSLSINAFINKLLQYLVLFYQIMAVVVVGLSLLWSYQWLSVPFIGGFFEHSMVLNNSDTTVSDATWAMYEKGFVLNDQLVSVNGQPVQSSADIRTALDTFQVGDAVPVEIKVDATGQVVSTDVILIQFPAQDWVAYYIIPGFISLIFLAVGGWIFGFRRSEPAGRAFSVLASSLGIAIGTLSNIYTTHQFTHVWTLAVTMIGGAFLDLAFIFPQESRLVIGRSYLRTLGYFTGVILTLNAFLTLFDLQSPTDYIGTWQGLYLFMGLSGLFYFGILGYRALRSTSPIVKNQARTILFGSLLAFAPSILSLLWGVIVSNLGYPPIAFNPFLLLFTVAFPLTNGYVILRYRLIRTDVWLRQGIVYSVLAFIVVFAYGLFVSGLGMILTINMPSDNPLLISALVFLIAIVLDPLRTRLQAYVDTTFFRGQRAYEERLRTFSHELTSALDMNTIGRVLRQQIASSLVPERIHIYTYDALNDQYIALPDVDGRPTSDVRFTSNSPLVQYFRQENIPLYLDSINPPTLLRTDEARISLLGARLFLALPSEQRPVGWIALGAPLAGGVYTPRDLEFLENLADQASLAISRVQTVLNLERRVQEMNALTRVSQGVNITLTFDDVLELIFAQATQIIPSTNFHITLYNKAASYFYYGFCVEDRDRTSNRENKPLPANYGLEQDIIRKARPVITQDYTRECQARNVTPSSTGVYAWMGVPLNSNTETIGALSVGSRDASVTYTRAQLELLQAIADQTVGAIVRSRLLQETEKRAAQLSTLNDITRQLTSTLEQEPLLQNILENAVKILNCEAGSLFLMDEQTGELIFKVIVGGAGSNLLGQRLPPGAGIVGRAVQTRMPIIENEGQRSSTRFAAADKQTGFTSRALLAVPMLIKDRVLGVIEVINRKDELPFVQDDEILLTAFAGQAAVAIENARLITLTDQELNARVEELSVMGRIVRELNATLELDRAMRITIDSAMRQSNAEAGLIGMLDDKNLHIMVQEGFEEELTDKFVTQNLLDTPAIKTVLENAQPTQISLITNNVKGLYSGAHTQVIVPIRREADVTGLIILESTSDSQVNLGFLNRLSDNAAIAISNAQLYDEVQRANHSKSEFVSLVAHELKNPMTSIKGYSELLAAGSVGQINDMQSNFLGTIRSNVERMSALVSDLNDQAKIEAGRLRLDFKMVALPDVVDDVIRSTKRQVDEKHQEVLVQLSEYLPDVWADRIRVGQILTNLVSNANKYTPEGGKVTVGAEATDNRWDPEGVKHVVHLWVKDDGIGISPEDQEKIFQKFFRSDDSKAREAPGTGLGLNITKSLVEMQGGRIWFESEFRSGTTFHFTIPTAEGSS